MVHTCLLDGGHGLDSSIIQVIGGNQTQSTVFQQLLPNINIGPLQSHNHGHLQIQLLASLNNTRGNDITLHNPPKYIHQYSLDGGITRDNLKRRLDLIGRGTAPHIQKIGGFAAVQTDNVHGTHRQTRTVHHAADITVQTDIIQIPFPRRHLPRILLAGITLRKHIGLAKLGIIVKPDLGIGRDEITLEILGQRIHFHHGAITIHKHFIQRLDLILRRLYIPARGQPYHHLLRLRVGQTVHRIHRHLDDFFGGAFRQILDGGSSLGASNDQRASAGTIHHNGEIKLARQ
mmetsp:Transcript_51082/g.51498  ORF Transcript_51082/g.51498 Transcript_51082/m.51498 type:complete len:289 (-) Transcript_51082:250-1116(-)